MRIAIVGVGPRGLCVYERLCANLDRARRAEVFLIDSTAVGTGAVWRVDQPGQLLMNTVASQVSVYTDATVEMTGPVRPGPSLSEWATAVTECPGIADLPDPIRAEAYEITSDTYPTRAFYGHYLRWVLRDIRDRHADRVRTHEITATVTDLRDEPSGSQRLELASGEHLSGLDAVVLAQGHVGTRHPPELRALAKSARAGGLHYVPPGNAADVALHQLPAGEAVIIRGLGLTFFDYMALLTAGRGGRFEPEGDRLRYLPSGAEPVIVAGCRRGVPHHARGENQKGVAGRHVPRLLDQRRITELRSRAQQYGDVSFRRDVWPLVAREVESVYYRTLLADRVDPGAAHRFGVDYLLADDPERALARAGIAAGERWDWAAVGDPARGLCFADRDRFHDWMLDYLDSDVRDAMLGNVRGPVKAALDVLRDLRNEVRMVVDHRGITGASYRDDLDRWYTPLNAFLSIGPPAGRIAELAALIRAGVVRIVGPGMRLRIDSAPACFVADSARVAGSRTTARFLVDAWIPAPDLRDTADPLMRTLLRGGVIHGYTLPGPETGRYRTGGLTVAPDSHAVVEVTGRPHARRFAFGVPTEAVHWATAAGPRPGVNSVTLADADAVARAALTAAAAPPRGTKEGTNPMTVDHGLLAPVRAGVPVERCLGDEAWVQAMVEVEMALARAQERVGIVPPGVSEAIATAAGRHRFDARALSEAGRGAANPVVAFVAELHRAVAAVDPVAADHVHRGSTSQDILDTAAMVIAARTLGIIIDDLDDTMDSLARLARIHRDTPVAGRTLAVHAVPTTFGAKVAAWIQGLADARDRLRALASTGLPVQLGGAAGTFASYVECARLAEGGELADAAPEVVYERLAAEFAAELSLATPPAPWHTVRTPIADLAGVLATTAGALGKFAVDVIAQARTEVLEVAEPAAAGRGESSAMPQKRNPALSAMIRAAALQVPALASILFGAMSAEDERPAGAWHAEWQPLRDCLLLVGGAAHTAAELAAGLEADAARMGATLDLTEGQIVAERLSVRLAPLLGRAEAKKTLQAAAFEAHSTGRRFGDILMADTAIRSHLSEAQLADLLRPENYLGAAPAFVDRALRRL